MAGAGAVASGPVTAAAQASRSGMRIAAVRSAFLALAASASSRGLTTWATSTGSRSTSTMLPRAARAAARVAGSSESTAARAGGMASMRRWPTSSRSIGRSLPDAAGRRFLISASTSAPDRLEIEPVAALARSASASTAPSRRTASAEALPAAPSDSSAASLVSLLPFAAAATRASTAAGLFRSASARRRRAARLAGSLESSATRAVSHFPGLTSRAVESPRRKTDCSGD